MALRRAPGHAAAMAQSSGGFYGDLTESEAAAVKALRARAPPAVLWGQDLAAETPGSDIVLLKSAAAQFWRGIGGVSDFVNFAWHH